MTPRWVFILKGSARTTENYIRLMFSVVYFPQKGNFYVSVRPLDEEKRIYVTRTGKMWLAAEAWSVGCHADFGLSQMQTADHKSTRLHREPKISHKHLTTEAERRRENLMFWGHWSRAMGRSSGPHSCTRPSKLTWTENLCCVFKLRILDFRCNRLTQSSVHIWDPQCHIIYLNMSHTTYLISSLLATYFSFCQERYRRATESGTSWTSASFWRLSNKIHHDKHLLWLFIQFPRYKLLLFLSSTCNSMI